MIKDVFEFLMNALERSQRGKFRKIILEESFTFRRVAGCRVVLLNQLGVDIVRQVNLDTGLYTAPNPYPPNTRLLRPQARSNYPQTNPQNFAMFERCIK